MVRRSSTVNFERIAHLQDRITFVPGDLLDQMSMINILSRAPTRGGLQPRRAVLRADVVRPAGAHRRDHRASASPASSTPSASSIRRSASTRRRRARCSARCSRGARRRETHAAVPALARTAWPRSTATGSRSTTARATTCTPARASCSTTRAPRRGLEFVTRKISHHGGQDQARAGRRAAARQPRSAAGLGLRRRLRRGDVADAAAGLARRLCVATGETHPVREFCEVAFGHVGTRLGAIRQGRRAVLPPGRGRAARRRPVEGAGRARLVAARRRSPIWSG